MTFGDYELGSSTYGDQISEPGNIDTIVTSIDVGNKPCNGGCDVACTSNGCLSPEVTDITITWQNNGETESTFIPTINVTPQGETIPILYPLYPIRLAAGDVIPTIFTNISLIQGSNQMCINKE